MPVILAPSDQAIPDGYVNPAHLLCQGVLNTADSMDWGWSSATPDAGVTAASFDMFMTAGVGGPQLLVRDNKYTETNVAFHYTATAPTPFAFYLVGGGGRAYNSHGTAHGAYLNTTLGSLTYCAHGTELQPAANFVYYLTPGLLDVWLAEVEMPWLAPIFTAFWFSTLNVQELCGTGPPPLPVIDLSTLNASAETALQILKVIAWPNVCQCKPGTPAPTPYPPPSAPQPPGWPAPPTFACDELNVCDTLLQLQKQMSALQQTMGETLGLATLLQRYGLPFAYINGPTHLDVHASGSFQVSRLVGVKVHVRQYPTGNRVFSGEPPYVSDLGWLSLETIDGLVDEIRLTRENQTWFPRLMPMATTFGISLRDGVRVDIQELIAEP